MNDVILDAGALVAIERDDRHTLAKLHSALRHGRQLRTNPMVIAQVWRDKSGRQANLARMLKSVDVRVITETHGRQIGELLGRSRTSDAIDASLLLLAERGDHIMTSDPKDIARLIEASGIDAFVIAC